MTDQTLLYRQVHPSFVVEDWITSQVFKPTPKDDGKLSAYDGDQVSAQDSWTHYTASLGHQSAGVVSTIVAECKARGLDVQFDGINFLSHVSIDFDGHSNSAVQRIAKQLRKAAKTRGWHYQA